MARLGISGFVIKFDVRKSSKKEGAEYGVLDVLQIGDSDYNSSLLNLIVYDKELNAYLTKNYTLGTVAPFNGVVEYVQIKSTEHMWVLKKIVSVGENALKGAEEDGRTEQCDVDNGG